MGSIEYGRVDNCDSSRLKTKTRVKCFCIMCNHASHYRIGKLASLTRERSRCQHQATESIYFTDHARECSRCQHQVTQPISLWTMLANAHVVNTRPLSQSTSRTMHGNAHVVNIRPLSQSPSRTTLGNAHVVNIRPLSRSTSRTTLGNAHVVNIRPLSQSTSRTTLGNAHVVNIRPLSQSTSRTTLGNAHVVNIRPLSQSASRTTLGNAHVVNIRPLSRSTSRTMLGMIKRLASRIYTLEYFCQYLYASRVTRFLLMNKFYSFVWSFIDANGRHFTARSLRMLFEDIPLDCITISLSKGDKHFWKVQSSGAVSKSRWTSWAPVSNKPTVSVDVKQHSTNWKVIKTKRTF